MSSFCIHVLGGFRLLFGSETVHLPPLQAQIVSLLALNKNCALRRNVIADYFWPTVDNELALRRLRIAIAKLKSKVETATGADIGQLVRSTSATLELAEVDTDYEALFACSEHIETDTAYETVRTIIDTTEPDLLPDWDFEWLAYKRELIQEHYRACVFQLLTYASAHNNYGEATRWGGVLMKIDPYDEAAAQELVDVLIQSGRRVQAINLFKIISKKLRNDYGIAPSSRLQKSIDMISYGPGH